MAEKQTGNGQPLTPMEASLMKWDKVRRWFTAAPAKTRTLGMTGHSRQGQDRGEAAVQQDRVRHHQRAKKTTTYWQCNKLPHNSGALHWVNARLFTLILSQFLLLSLHLLCSLSQRGSFSIAGQRFHDTVYSTITWGALLMKINYCSVLLADVLPLCLPLLLFYGHYTVLTILVL